MNPLVLRGIVQARGTGRRRVGVLQDVSLEVAPGERILLEGPSGSGKTTLLGVAAGLLTPQAGEALLVGQPLALMSPSQRSRLRARHVGFVFQRANLLEGLTVLDNVVLTARLAGSPGAEARRAAHAVLERLGLGELAHRYPRELSGGEEQRAAVARAVVHRPSVVLADEPTGSLDRAAGEAVLRELTELATACGSAVVMATHDARLAVFAERRIRLNRGRLQPAAGES